MSNSNGQYRLKKKLSVGNLAAYTSAIRDFMPKNWSYDNDPPKPEAVLIQIQAAAEAEFFEGDAPTEMEARDWDLQKADALATSIHNLFIRWSRLGSVDAEEKKG